MKVETEAGVVRLEHDVAEHMNGWSKQIQPEIRKPGETPSEQTLWLNTYLDFWRREE